VAVGGGTRSRLLTQIVSDVTGRPQVVPEETIGASYGSALLAAIGTGALPAGADWARRGHVVEPDPAAGRRYEELFLAFSSLYADTAHHMHRLSDLAGTVPDQPAF
jgi:xylulokinase